MKFYKYYLVLNFDLIYFSLKKQQVKFYIKHEQIKYCFKSICCLPDWGAITRKNESWSISFEKLIQIIFILTNFSFSSLMKILDSFLGPNFDSYCSKRYRTFERSQFLKIKRKFPWTFRWSRDRLRNNPPYMRLLLRENRNYKNVNGK